MEFKNEDPYTFKTLVGCCMDHESVSILKLQMRDTGGPCKRTIRINVKTRFGF